MPIEVWIQDGVSLPSPLMLSAVGCMQMRSDGVNVCGCVGLLRIWGTIPPHEMGADPTYKGREADRHGVPEP